MKSWIKSKILLFFLLIIPMFLFSQIERNMFLERNFIVQKYNWSKTHIRNTSDMLIEEVFNDTNNFLHIGLQADAFIQNASIDYSWNYNDQNNIMASPIFWGRGTKNLTFYMSGIFQNHKTDIIDSRKYYLGQKVWGFWGDFEISKIVYQDENFYIKFGRDYFLPGMYFYESILFSRYQYPYDQLHIAYRNKMLEVSSYYLRLNDMIDKGERYLRHLNGHRVSLNLFNKGYVAFSELLLATGVQRPVNIAVFNPFLIYFIYMYNERIESTNSMLAMDFFIEHNNLFLHGEFILDDYMIEHEVYGDLEPTKYGINLTFGIKDILPDLHWNVNYTRIANRVYNTYNPRINVERFIHENLSIGHYLGSNLWEFKSSITYLKNKYQGELQFIYRQTGDDVLYSPYNTDHFQGHNMLDPLEPGAEWKEPFPYVSDGGEPDVFWGFKIDNYYQLMDYLGLNLKASYWFEKGLLSSHFNIAGGVYFNF